MLQLSCRISAEWISQMNINLQLSISKANIYSSMNQLITIIMLIISIIVHFLYKICLCLSCNIHFVQQENTQVEEEYLLWQPPLQDRHCSLPVYPMQGLLFVGLLVQCLAAVVSITTLHLREWNKQRLFKFNLRNIQILNKKCKI